MAIIAAALVAVAVIAALVAFRAGKKGQNKLPFLFLSYPFFKLTGIFKFSFQQCFFRHWRSCHGPDSRVVGALGEIQGVHKVLQFN
jgi:hypothetical protein